MREGHPSLDPNVAADAVIWRYMDFPKFMSLLKESALWFSRADLLGDPLEGSFTEARALGRQLLLENPPDGRTRQDLEAVFAHNTKITSEHRTRIFINCWHRGDHESMALWKGYGDGPYAVAVRSTFGQLDSVLPIRFSGSSVVEGGALAEPTDEPPHAMPIYLSQVKYIDHSSKTDRLVDEGNLFTPYACKSIAYKHENEIRGIYWNIPGYDSSGQLSNPPGLFVPIDLAKLVNEVVISPLAPSWVLPLVGSIVEKYGFAWPVVSSMGSRMAVY